MVIHPGTNRLITDYKYGDTPGINRWITDYKYGDTHRD
jgi:hypothetical protein